jgi:hypothetical protein
MAKPSDFFVGVTDLFSIILPGAALTFVLLKVEEAKRLDVLSLRSLGRTPSGYIAFFVTAYLLGHLTDMVGATILDWTYDRTHASWRRSSIRAWLYGILKRSHDDWWRTRNSVQRTTKRDPLYVWSHTWMPWLGRTGRQFRIECMRMRTAFFGTPRQPTDVLFENAKDLAQKDMPKGDRVYQWSRTWVQLKSPLAFSECERLQANSKFFRGLVVVAIFAAILAPKFPDEFTEYGRIVCLSISFVAFVRYADLRWKAIHQVYRSFIALHSDPVGGIQEVKTNGTKKVGETQEGEESDEEEGNETDRESDDE